jgi:hypothetical protein
MEKTAAFVGESGQRERTSARAGRLLQRARGAPQEFQDAEKCSHLLAPHFAKLHVISFRINACDE